MPSDQQILTVKALEEAVALLLANNFDADSIVCLKTILKIVDNLLHKPGNVTVRRLKLSNATVWSKIGQRRGGLDILVACGFEKEPTPSQILASPFAAASSANTNNNSTADETNSSSFKQSDTLHLPPNNEDQSTLITARRLLETRLMQDLKVPDSQIPIFRPPPPPISAQGTSGSFNVYAGHRFDAQSAAVGTQLGPPPGGQYQSKTATQLSQLQQQHARLEKRMHQQRQQQSLDRQWRAFRPNDAPPTARSMGTSSSSAPSSDSALLAARMQQQTAARKQREEGGFTTAAMRELERLQKQKVYSHVTLLIQFPSGHAVQGCFGPNERIETVRTALRDECLVPETVVMAMTNHDDDAFDLYVTPPRQLLGPKQTLKELGLVPAAKIFVSWKNGATPTTLDFLQPPLFAAGATAFPTAHAVAPNDAASSATASSTTTQKKTAKKKKTDKQEEMLKRMMGKGL